MVEPTEQIPTLTSTDIDACFCSIDCMEMFSYQDKKKKTTEFHAKRAPKTRNTTKREKKNPSSEILCCRFCLLNRMPHQHIRSWWKCSRTISFCSYVCVDFLLFCRIVAIAFYRRRWNSLVFHVCYDSYNAVYCDWILAFGECKPKGFSVMSMINHSIAVTAIDSNIFFVTNTKQTSSPTCGSTFNRNNIYQTKMFAWIFTNG